MRLVFSKQRPEGAPNRPSGHLRLLVLCVAALGAFLVPAAQAMAAEVPLTLETEGSGSGTIECSVEEGPVEGCEDEYEAGTEVAFVATPSPGSEFWEWGGDCIGQAEECELTLEGATVVTAVFELEEVPLEVTTEGEGLGEVECDAGSGPEVCEPEYPFGTEITFVAEPEEGSEFVEWEGDCGGATCELTMDEEHSVTAVFELAHFALEVAPEGTGSGTVTSEPAGIDCGVECEAEYEEGEEVTLTAAADPGSEFVEWTGCDATPSPEECEVTMDADKEVSATFDLEPPSEFALKVSPAGTGSGTVTSSPPGIDCGVDCSEAYAAGIEVTLTATPASGSTFGGWSGDCTGTGPCKVTMSQARGVTATFTKEATPPAPEPGTASVASTAKVKSGKAQLKLTCKGEGPCKGTLKLSAKVKSGGKTKNVVIGKASFSLAAGAAKTIAVKLSGPAKQAVAKKALKARVSGSDVRSSTVKLKK